MRMSCKLARSGVWVHRAGIIAAVWLFAGASGAFAGTELLISEYVEGSGNNKAIELYNGTDLPIDLAAGHHVLKVYFNGGQAAGLTINLGGVVAAGGTFVLAHGNASAEILALAQQTDSSGWFNGDDAIELTRAGVVIDSIGQVGVDPGSAWGSGLVSTQDHSLRRKLAVTAGRVDSGAAFDPALEWSGHAINDIGDLGLHAGGGAGDVAGDVIPQPPPGPGCNAPFTPAHTIQGRGAATPLSGVVSTQGVVVGDYEGPSPALRGFYLQDVTGDNDAATSDAVFVFNGNNDQVQPGQLVRVTGTVGEFQNQTQVSASSVEVCGSASVQPVDVMLPMVSADDFERFEGMLVRLPQTLTVTEHFQLGRFGQVVLSSDGRLRQPTHVALPGVDAQAIQARNDLNRIILDDGDNAQNPATIVFGRNGQPLSAANTLRGGDTATGMGGVMTYTWAGNSASGNAWRVRPVHALAAALPDFQAANPRPDSAPAPAGLRVAGVNVLNYFNSFGTCAGGIGGAALECRGAQDAVELDRQQAKTVAALVAMDADVVGLVEIENDGYGSASAQRRLVDALDTATAPGTWALLDADARTGQVNAMGQDAIKVGLIYRAARVAPVGNTAVLGSTEFQNAGDGAPRNRPALAQAFQQIGGDAAGERVIVVVNHLKSKGSACDTPDAGDGQGNCNGVRLRAARMLRAWLATDPTGTGDPDVLVFGDLNAYAKEDPIRSFTDNGWVDLIAAASGAEAYSYVFDGQWGYLDHALATASLAAQVAHVVPWSVNADEPSVLDYNTNFKSAAQIAGLFAPDAYRYSDHDPVLVDLRLLPVGSCVVPDPSPVVVLGGEASGVVNRVIDKGCTIDDLIDDEQPWTSRSAFLLHVSKVSIDLLRQRKISAAERSRLMAAALASGIGVAAAP